MDPMSTVGSATKVKATSPVCSGPAPAVKSAAQWKVFKENIPYDAISNSTRPKTWSSGRRRARDSAPPTRLPRPSPSMKAVTTMVTDSMFTPYSVNSARCHTI